LSNINAYKYRAFITYAHKDEDRARWLRKKLETFRVPKHLVGTDGDHGEVPSRLYPIFRDRDELAGAAQLGPLIEQALTDSSHLIVLCSPHAVKSRWVNEEIRMFKSMGKSDRVLCLVLSGDPMSEDMQGGVGKECIPLAARREVDKDGLVTDHKDEPAAADLRETADGEKDALLKIIAGLLGLGLDDLKQRDLLARQKRLARIAFASAFLAISAIALAAYAFYQQNQASIAKANAEEERQLTSDELDKTQAITNFVQNLFFSLDPQNTEVMDTELIKTMLDQGSMRAGKELSDEPEIEARIRLCLGKTYRSIRSYDKAQIELSRVLELFDNTITEELPTRMAAMNEIAMVHDALGNYVQAQPMLVELLEERTKKFGTGHEDVIDTQIDLAIVYRRIGKIEQAENQCSKALSLLNDQNRTDDDPLSLKCMSELAKIYLSAEKFSQGESLARNVYEKSRIRYGDNHASSLRAGQVLVEALRKADDLDNAEALSVGIVAGLEKVLGANHPDTLGATDSLARILDARNNFEGALTYYQGILSRKENALGKMHPETLATLQATAKIYRKLEKLEDAERTQTEVVDRLKKKHDEGEKHPETLRAMNELSDLYLALGKEDEAIFLSDKTLKIEREVMGEEDPLTLKTMFRIGKLQYLAGDTEGAMEMLGETLAKQEKLLGFDHPEATLTRDLLNQILGERATTKVTIENNGTSADSNMEDTSLLVFLEQFENDEQSIDENSTISSLPSFEHNTNILVKEDPEQPDLPEQQPEEEEKKGGFFKRLFSGESKDEENTSQENAEK
jgi:tetratricopeptide (TPR) repeat protein